MSPRTDAVKSPNDNRSIAHYRLLDRLGEGAMGVVYKAEDTRLGRTVALKLLAERLRDDPASLERFLREARAAARVNHPNVCMIFDVHDATTGDEPFIAMEFIEGITLRGCIEGHRREGGLLPVEVVASYATQIALGLDAAHRSGIIHRDVKSENIMLDAGGRVKVMDFGLARHEGAERLTRESSMMGTIAYMAPEVIQGSEPDARSDIFSFGVVVYEMLTGRLPFRGVHEPAMMYSIMHEEPAPLAMHREGDVGLLARVVERALAKDREQRYGSVAEILEELDPGRATVVARMAATPAGSSSRSLRSSGRRSVSGSVRDSQSGVQSAELRLYISGASEDLHEEREYLMKKVFPELRVVCRERGITFTEVDLRWGLTDEEVSDGRIIHACLEEIDRCRPYFIGIIGESYGAIPSFNEIQKYPVLLEAYPWIEEAALDGMSITEIEAEYAVLNPAISLPSPSGRGAGGEGTTRFYFRRQRTSLNEVGVESAERGRLEAFQQRVRQSGAHIEEYRDASLLGEQIYDQVIAIIKRDFADATAPTPLETERMRHTAFSQSRRRAYIANPLYLTQLNDHVASDNPPLVVYAESGSGKSSLFAYWAEQYRRKHPESHVIEHYVGIGATATDHYAIIRHFCLEVKERFGRDEEIPSEPAKLDLALGQWLGYADHELTRRGERMVLILDGLNQLQGVGRSLRWIPDVIAPSIRLVLSSTVEAMLVDLRKRGWGEFGMQALSEAERETIIVRYLAEYHTSLSVEQIKRIATDYKCGHPLFLKTVLEELRLVGRHEELDAKIESYLEATGTEDLFQRVLERLEEDYNMRAVRDVMTLLVASRSGLDERELSEISGLARFKIATMMAGLDYHLVRKEGRLTFFHDYLRRAVEKRYLSDEASRPAIHTKLGAYFERAEINVRNASELIYQYRRSESWQQLALALCRMERFMVLYCGETMYEVLADWRELGEHGHDIEAGYREALAQWGPEEGSSRLEGVYRVAELYDRIIHWEAAGELYRQMIEMAEAEADLAHSGAGHRGLGAIRRHQGRYDEAMEAFATARAIYEQLGNRRGLSIVIGNMGLVYWDRGEYDRALECYAQQEVICRELGDRRGLSTAIGNMGNVHTNHGEYDRALECYAQQEAICRELGGRRGVSTAIGNMGYVYSARGEHDRALECFTQMESICRDIGDRMGLSRANGGMGGVYSDRGEYDRALECFARWESICREIGDRIGLSRAIGGMGGVYSARGEYDRALECFVQTESICREIGDRSELSITIGYMGNVYSARGEYDRALECYQQALAEHREIGFLFGVTSWLEGRAGVLLELIAQPGEMPEYLRSYLPEATEERWRIMALEQSRTDATECVTISEQISKPDTVFSGRVLLARVEAAEGRRDVALQHLGEMLEETTDEAQRAELHYWLWKLSSLPLFLKEGEVHCVEALRLYESLVARTPKHDYRKRIDELTVITEPTTREADDVSAE